MRPENVFLLSSLIYRITIIPSLAQYDYCGRNCTQPNVRQPACGCRFGPQCLIPQIDWPNFRQAILDAHNEHRNRFANGVVGSQGVSGAANLRVLTYDYDLEYTARCHAKRCIYGVTCGITEDYGESGQNLATSTDPMTDPQEMARNAMNQWYWEESGRLTTAMAETFRTAFDGKMAAGARVARFTQVVWAASEALGCWVAHGRITGFRDRAGKKGPSPLGGQFRYLLTCNYGPAGNLEGMSMFEPGQAASGCPPDTRANVKYPGLCGEGEDDHLVPPPPSPGDQYGFKDPNETAGGEVARLGGFWGVVVVGGLVWVVDF